MKRMDQTCCLNFSSFMIGAISIPTAISLFLLALGTLTACSRPRDTKSTEATNGKQEVDVRAAAPVPPLDNASISARWSAMKVGEVLRECSVNYANVGFIDEPPGKLRAVEFRCASRDDQPIILAITYHAGLFSDQRRWAESLVSAQPVAGVYWSQEEYARRLP